MTGGHKLERYDRGVNLWGQCSCGRFVWLGSFHGEKRRYTAMRAEFVAHVAKAGARASAGVTS